MIVYHETTINQAEATEIIADHPGSLGIRLEHGVGVILESLWDVLRRHHTGSDPRNENR